MIQRRNSELLASHTSFRIGGPGRLYVEPTTIAELAESVGRCDRDGSPRFMLGGGTNTLFGDRGFAGTVISSRALTGLSDLGGGRLCAEAGVSLRGAIKEAIACGYKGIETLIGIPGHIGGAVYGNAGAVEHAIGDRVESVTLVEPNGAIVTVGHDDLPWSYRSSGIDRRVVAEVVLRLEPGHDPEELRRIARQVFQQKRDTQPLSARSAGCVFRNPPGERAARLIDRAGLKGMRVGGAGVSRQHANFIVNEEDATAEDVERLIAVVRRRVQEQFGFELEREIVLPSRTCEAGN